MHEFIIKTLESMGIAGAIIFVLMGVVTVLSEVIRRMYAHSNKVYGYRLTERDTLNKALTDSAKVLTDMLAVTKDRNDITEEQAELIAKQTAAFELLKVTILAQYENIKENNHVVAQSVSSMAEAMRTLTSMTVDSRNLAANQVVEIKHAVAAETHAVENIVRTLQSAHIIELRRILDVEVTTIRRRKSPE